MTLLLIGLAVGTLLGSFVGHWTGAEEVIDSAPYPYHPDDEE